MTFTEDHSYDGTRHVEIASYSGRVHACLCGEARMEKSEILEHVREEGERDELQRLLYAAAISGLYVTTGSQIVERGWDLHTPSAASRQFEADRESQAVGG